MRDEDIHSDIQRRILAYDGYPPNPEALENTEDGLLAVLPDDRIVVLMESTRIRVGNSGAGASSSVSVTWFWDRERQGPAGIYNLIKELPKAVEHEWMVRCATQKSRAKRSWYNAAQTLARQCIEDCDDARELAEEIIATGLAKWLEESSF